MYFTPIKNVSNRPSHYPAAVTRWAVPAEGRAFLPGRGRGPARCSRLLHHYCWRGRAECTSALVPGCRSASLHLHTVWLFVIGAIVGTAGCSAVSWASNHQKPGGTPPPPSHPPSCDKQNVCGRWQMSSGRKKITPFENHRCRGFEPRSHKVFT